MTSIIRNPRRNGRYDNFPLSKREFLTPFDQIIDSFLNDKWPNLHRELGNDFFLQGSYPKCNVVDFDDRIEIEAAIPGLSKEDVVVEIIEDVLTIKAESNQRESIEDSQYVRREVKRSAFARSFRLGDNLIGDSIEATHRDGILTLSIPKEIPTNSEPVGRTIDIK